MTTTHYPFVSLDGAVPAGERTLLQNHCCSNSRFR